MIYNTTLVPKVFFVGRSRVVEETTFSKISGTRVIKHEEIKNRIKCNIFISGLIYCLTSTNTPSLGNEISNNLQKAL